MTNERNIAYSLAEHLPKPQHLGDSIATGGSTQRHYALPKGFEIKTVDDEAMRDSPRRAKGTGRLDSAQAFLAYVERHKSASTVIWCSFDPQTFKLKFTAVFDDHSQGSPGWRGHAAVFEPAMSAEWKAWTGKDGTAMKQLEFAEFLERHADDINAGDPAVFPTSLQMLSMATQFEATSEKRIKSAVRLQNGGVRIDYVDDADAGTIAQMQAFDKFQIGIPVFWAGMAFRIEARLRWRQRESALHFHYELVRPDRVHESAAEHLIGLVREGSLDVPLLMGNFTTG